MNYELDRLHVAVLNLKKRWRSCYVYGVILIIGLEGQVSPAAVEGHLDCINCGLPCKAALHPLYHPAHTHSLHRT